jgi:hypothetical protein
MSASLHVLRRGLVSLAVLGVIGAQASARMQSVTPEATERSVRRLTERRSNVLGGFLSDLHR